MVATTAERVTLLVVTAASKLTFSSFGGRGFQITRLGTLAPPNSQEILPIA